MAFLSSQHHSFDVLLAKKYGMEKSVLIHHFMHWIRINRHQGRNLKNGKCWTYQTRKQIQSHFPYWTFEEVRYLCERLVADGVLVTGNFNKSKIDKTLWYAFVDEKAFGLDAESSNNVYEREKSLTRGKSPTPIPDTKTTYSKRKHTKERSDKVAASANAMRLSSLLLETIKITKPNFRSPNLKSWDIEFDKLITGDGVTEDRIKRVLRWLPSNDFWKTNILSAKTFRKQFDALELKMEADLDKPKKPIDTFKEEEAKRDKERIHYQLCHDIALKIGKKFPEERKTGNITIHTRSITFCVSVLEQIEVKFGEKNFKDKCLKALKAMHLDISEL